ncbi:S8 family serine peptidase [Sorangium sp. So ce1097]|uniref:S8 family serine peptidase n=1 Tax=Sorangium sp. So ce1097 TaxID=3133330 RepID=UPI003F5F61E9
MSTHQDNRFNIVSRHVSLRRALHALLLGLSASALGCGDTAPPAEPVDRNSEPVIAGDQASSPAQGLRAALDKSKAPSWVPSDVSDVRIVIKFHEGTGVRLRGGQLNSDGVSARSSAVSADVLRRDLASIATLLAGRSVVLEPLFPLPEARLASLKSAGERRTSRRLPELALYFDAPWSGGSRSELVDLVEALNAHPSVEIAYVQPKPELAAAPPEASAELVALDANTPDFTSLQGYVADDANGMGVTVARSLPGGRGENVQIIDVEQHWVPDHEDLPAPFFYAPAAIPGDATHGTAVAGVMVGQENGFGVTGVAPLSSVGYASWVDIGVGPAIALAAAQLDPGDVVLIEVHAPGPTTVSCSCNHGQCNYVPMEFFSAEFDAIQTATANGIIVVEAAGNGSVDLDHPTYGGVFDRSVRDSGALVVGASLSTSRSPTCYSNTGDRVDVHAWGENVVTTGGAGELYSGALGARDAYTAGFAGTSSASAVVSGAVAVVQSVAQEASGPLTPQQLRDLLVNSGKPQQGELSREIGPLPDVAAAASLAADPGSCGDNVCSAFESCQSCEVDCGPCSTCVPSGCEAAAQVTLPYVINGSVDSCVFFTGPGSNLNSWNMTTVELNGISFLNTWVASSNYPPTCDGGYYLRLDGDFAWSHIEVN